MPAWCPVAAQNTTYSQHTGELTGSDYNLLFIEVQPKLPSCPDIYTVISHRKLLGHLCSLARLQASGHILAYWQQPSYDHHKCLHLHSKLSLQNGVCQRTAFSIKSICGCVSVSLSTLLTLKLMQFHVPSSYSASLHIHLDIILLCTTL